MTTQNYSEWYEKHYHELSGSGLWLRGGELNTNDPSQFDGSACRVLITRLSTWKDTADSFTHKLLYQFASNVSGVFADLAYLPPPDDSEIFIRDSIPWLLGTNTKCAAVNFDMVAISLSIIQELINLPILLRRSMLPLGKKERMRNRRIPLIILGGASSPYTSALMSGDPLVDGIYTGGDAEDIQKIFTICRNGKSSGAAKEDILNELKTVSGFFQPEINEIPKTRNKRRLIESQLLGNAPVLYSEDQIGKGNLQISEGCPCFCSFCAESWSRKPYLEFSSSVLKPAALTMKAHMGLDSIEIYSFNFNMHGEFYAVLRDMCGIFQSVGLKSQRFDYIADNPEILHFLHTAGKSSITCGLEGISPRLRNYLHKSINEKSLKTSLNAILRTPLRELKIFLIATGLENEEDFSELRSLLSFITVSIQSSGRRPRLIFSMTPLVRFPFTPLESESAPLPEDYKEIIFQTERIIRSRGFEFRTSSETDDYLISQILLRASDSRVMQWIDDACVETGFIYYQDFSENFINAFKKNILEAGASVEAILSGKSWNKKLRAPVLLGVNDEFLERKTRDAKNFIDDGYCLGSINGRGVCRGCGACEDSSQSQTISSQRTKSPYSVESFKTYVKENRKFESIDIAINLLESRRGIPRKAVGGALARSLMLADSRLIKPYKGFEESLTEAPLMSSWIHGDDCLTLRFNPGALPDLKRLFQDTVFLEKVNSFMLKWGKVYGLFDREVSCNRILHMESTFDFDASRYLKSKALKYTVRKAAPDQMNYEFAKDSLKKKIILKMKSYSTDGKNLIIIEPGPKFEYREFILSSFALPSESAWVRIITTQKFMP